MLPMAVSRIARQRERTARYNSLNASPVGTLAGSNCASSDDGVHATGGSGLRSSDLPLRGSVSLLDRPASRLLARSLELLRNSRRDGGAGDRGPRQDAGRTVLSGRAP